MFVSIFILLIVNQSKDLLINEQYFMKYSETSIKGTPRDKEKRPLNRGYGR